MTVTILGRGPAVSEEALRQLERSLPGVLPTDYREFLAANNGGTPRPNIIDIAGLPGMNSDVQVFFGLNTSVESSDLLWNLRERGFRLRSGLCGIASDSSGNLFCMDLSGAARGTIYFIDMDPDSAAIWYGESTSPGQTEFKVADSFAEFLKKLHD